MALHMLQQQEKILAFGRETPIQSLQHPQLAAAGIELWVKREDLIHPAISGNKWRKLKHNLLAASKAGYRQLLSFGGAYSNHIYALAAAGKLFGFETLGFIRGEQHLPLNKRLGFVIDQGMQLHYLSRSRYRQKNNAEFLADISAQFPHAFVIPEGGSNALAIPGVLEMMQEINTQKGGFDYYMLACGSGGTTAGLLASNPSGNIVAVSVLKGGSFLKDEISLLLGEYGSNCGTTKLELMLDYHFGGYAKHKPALLDFIQQFEADFGIPTEPVYTGKMFFALFDLLSKGYFRAGSRILAIHTGGLAPC